MSNMYPGPYQAPPPGPTGPVYQVRLTMVSSFIIMTRWRTDTYQGPLDQLEDIARRTRNHNLLLGWWGFPWGLIRTPMALSKNSTAMTKVRALAAQGAVGVPVPPRGY